MSTRLPASNPLAYVGLKETNPPQLYFRTRAPLATDAGPYDVGDIWIDQTALESFILVLKVGAVATWIGMAGTGAAETLTGDAGGAVGPDGADNINFLGNSVGFQNGIQFTGTPGNNTLTAMDLRNITVYVVDAVAGQTEYQTVQAAITAANADGGGTVYIRPGTYTEDLILSDGVDLVAAVATPIGFQTTIIGSHTPPATGAVSLRNLSLSDTTNILNSAVAGTTTLVIIDCVTDVANGYTFQLANWTGLIGFINSHCIGTQDGFADIGAGGANFLGLNSTLGVGATNIMALGGVNRINNCNIDCSMDWVGTASGIIRASQLTNTWLVSDNAACVMTDTLFITDASLTFLNHTSNGNVTLSNVTISTDQDPDVITGTGTVIFGSVVFALNSDINVGITKQSVGNVETGPTHIGSGATDPTNHIDIVEEVIADDVTILALNTDNTDPASDTIVNLLTGGANGGDPFLHLEVSAVTEYSFGIDNSATDILKLTDGATPSAGNELWRMTTAGERTMPLQPAFLANHSANQDNATGNAAVATVNYTTEIFDQNADYDGTNTFTASVTGRYEFEGSVYGINVTAAMTQGAVRLVTSNRTYRSLVMSPAAVRQAATDLQFCVNALCDMDAADTAHITISISNGVGNTVDLNATTEMFFSGCLIV